MSLLTLQGVSKRFGDVPAVDGASFSVDRGQVVGFLGPNGAGKSTTMRMITQYYEPDQGEILFDGVPLAAASLDAKRRIGYLPENNPLYCDMLVADYLAFVADLRELKGPERRRALDDAVQATAVESVYYRPIGELSKGYKQRVGLTAAILHRPDLLVLDEPTEGLDPNQRIEIRHLISHLGRDRTVMLSTHVLPEVQQTCSRLLIIHHGRIAADGPVEQLMAQAQGMVQISVEVDGAAGGGGRGEGEGPAEVLGALPGVKRVERTRDVPGRTAFTLSADGQRDLRPEIFRLAAQKGWTLYELHQASGSVEDLFRQLTASPPDEGREGQRGPGGQP